jgi:hypothetical protein
MNYDSPPGLAASHSFPLILHRKFRSFDWIVEYQENESSQGSWNDSFFEIEMLNCFVARPSAEERTRKLFRRRKT